MKLRVVSLVGSLLLLFSFYALAADKPNKHSETVSFTSNTKVASTQLTPGDYTIEWTDNAPQVEVKFLKNGKTVATAPATVQNQTQKEPYSYGAAATLKTLPDHTAVLQNINTKNVVLKFESPS